MPLTAEQNKTVGRKLKQWLENDRQIVTFRQISREIGCHVDLAKNVLLEHARSNPSLEITYLLSGPLLSTSSLAQTQLKSDGPQLDAKALAAIEASQRVKIRDMDEVSDGERNSEDGTEGDDEMVGNDKGGEGGISGKGTDFLQTEPDSILTPEPTPRWGVVMAQQAQFEVKRGLFEPEGLNIHIYALSPAPISDPAQYLVPNTQLRQYPKYNDIKYGGISGDFPAEGSGSGSKPLKDGGMNFGSTSVVSGSKKPEVPAKKVVEKDTKGKTAIKGKAEVEEKAPAKDVKPKVVKEEVKPKEATKVTAKPKATPPMAATTSRKASTQSTSQKSKKRIITSDDESEVATDTVEPPAVSSPAAAAKVNTSSMIRETDQAAMEAMMGMGMSDDEGFEIEGKAKPAKGKKAPAVKKPETGTSKSGRKTRVIKKSKTEMDAKGYMVTRDYTSEESYSGESDAAPSNAKSKAKPRKSATSTSTAKLAAGSQSRASSVSTDINEEKDSRKGGSSAAVGSSTSVTSAPAAKPKAPVPPPKNVPGKAGKPKGQSTLAGFFTKK